VCRLVLIVTRGALATIMPLELSPGLSLTALHASAADRTADAQDEADRVHACFALRRRCCLAQTSSGSDSEKLRVTMLVGMQTWQS
jgi:hypothetical protein